MSQDSAASGPRFTWDELVNATHGEWAVASPTSDGVCGVSTDTRSLPAGALFLALRGERFDGHAFVDAAVAAGAAAICVDTVPDEAPPVPCLRVDDTLAAYQALAACHRAHFPELLVVGITGSSGKTSSKEIVATVLRRHFGEHAVLATRGNTNNQIGVPQNLLRLTADHAAAVLEMGTNAPGEIGAVARLACPAVGVITSIGPVHLEGLGSVDGVAAEKADLLAALEPDGLAVVPARWRQHPAITEKTAGRRVISVGAADEDADIRIEFGGGDLKSARFRVMRRGEPPFGVVWPIPGAHQAVNAGAAFAIAAEIEMSDVGVVAALRNCQLPAMRLQTQEIRGVRWLNDAYNANPDSVRALIDCLRAAQASSRTRCVLRTKIASTRRCSPTRSPRCRTP
jgi:UDP-N-acetylmuramoyl-tripeptide--D-alanyl-D-alanine ligase